MRRLPDVLLQRDGALTRELEKTPGGLGLGLVPKRLAPDALTTLVCGYCSTGCGLDVHLRDGAAVNLSPAASYPVNRGVACPKGWEALVSMQSPERARTPLLRGPKGLAPVGWAEAIDTFVTRFGAITREHGPESAAFLSTGQIVNEEMAFLGALAKFGLGWIHGDGNTRQCMATAVTAYKESFGFDAPPYAYEDLELSDVIVLVGSNLAIAHPILWEHVARNPHDPELVVIDPRKTETAMAASQHLALAPKSDLVLFYGVANGLIQRGFIDTEYIARHTAGFEAFAKHVEAFPEERVARATGLAPEAISRLVETIHAGRRVSFWWTMGVNQSHEGTRVAQALINLALMTGNIGRPGTGANSITGQCNAMGSRLFSNTTNLLGGHAFANPAHRAKVAGALGIDVARIPDRDSLAYDQIIDGILRGKIKGLWIIATNSAHSWINQNDLLDALSRLEFLVVQDVMANTETAEIADLVLPAAGWGEKDGTFINSERRIGLIKKVAKAPGEALADFHIFRLIAEAAGCGDLFREWTSPEAVFEILKRVVRDQPCDIGGIESWDTLEASGGVQWPCAPGTEPDRPPQRLFTDGRYYTPDGRARFCFEAPRKIPERTSERYPLLLLTGRGSSSQWHTQTRTRNSAVLRKLAPEDVYVEIHPRDARKHGIEPGGRVRIDSTRGHVEARAFITRIVQPGQVFVPMHYRVTNRLTFSAVDPYSRQPAYKACAVRIRPMEAWE